MLSLHERVPLCRSLSETLSSDAVLGPGSILSFDAVERSHRTNGEEFYRLEKRGFKDLKDFMLKASEWIYYNYDRSHDGLGGKSPAEALREINPKLPSLQDPEGKDILFLPPIILDDRITLLGGGTEVYRHYTKGTNPIGLLALLANRSKGECSHIFYALGFPRFQASTPDIPWGASGR